MTETNRYNNSKIYKLVDMVNEYYYIGSTCLPLSKRLYQHKNRAKQYPERKVYKYFNDISWENVQIVLHQELYLDNKEQLLRAENDVIMSCLHDPLCLNSNRSLVDEVSKKNEHTDYMKQWRKERTEDKKEADKDSLRRWRQGRMEYVKAQKSVPLTCPCGSTVTKGNKLKHEQSKKHVAWLHDEKQTAETV